MRRVARSVIAREQLARLVDGGVDHEQNIVSALVETVTRLVVQELIEGEQGDFLGGRGRYQRRDGDQIGSRNGLRTRPAAHRRRLRRRRRAAGAWRRRAVPLLADELSGRQ